MTKTEPAREWSIGLQVLAGPKAFTSEHEETIGTNWWAAVEKLLHLINDWAMNDDRARGVDANRGQSARVVGEAWHRDPPTFDREAVYEIESHAGNIIRFYLAGERT